MGFQKVPPLTEVFTVSSGMTLVVSKFKLLTEVVTTSTHHLSSSAQWGEAIGQVSLNTEVVAEAD